MLLALVLATPIMGSPAKREEIAVVQPEYEVIPGPGMPSLESLGLTTADLPEYEIIPGPGMPSLESLGLTSADLFNKTFVDELLAPLAKRAHPEASALSRRFNNLCYEPPFGILEGIRGCAAYLWALGTQDCRAGNKHLLFRSNRIKNYFTGVYGISVTPGVSFTTCRNSAEGVYWIANNCDHSGCDAGDLCYGAGAAASFGNGNLVMVATGDHD
jgi:hypothetical protein